MFQRKSTVRLILSILIGCSKISTNKSVLNAEKFFIGLGTGFHPWNAEINRYTKSCTTLAAYHTWHT